MSCVDAETLLADLKAIVEEELKIVSYKWLARQYSIPSNYAKQVLFKFVQSEGAKVKAVYLVSGYFKGNETRHMVQLVDAADLSAVLMKLATHTSTHVYSVMPAEPNPTTDAARLVAEDIEQARHLYNSIIKHDALSNGSADVLAKNTCSGIRFTATIVPSFERKPRNPIQGQPKQQQPLSGGPKQPKQHQQALAGQKPAINAAPHAAANTAAATDGKQIGTAGTSSPTPAATAAAESPPPTAAAAAAPAAAVAAAGKGKAAAHKGAKKDSASLSSLWSKVPAKPAAKKAPAAAVPESKEEQAEPAAAAAADMEPVDSPAVPARGRQRGRQQLIEEEEEEDNEQEQQVAKKPRGRVMLDSDDDNEIEQEVFQAIEAPVVPAEVAAPPAKGKNAAGPATAAGPNKTFFSDAKSAATGQQTATAAADGDAELLSAVGEIPPAAGKSSKPSAGNKKQAATASKSKPKQHAKAQPKAQQKDKKQQQQQRELDEVSCDQDADAMEGVEREGDAAEGKQQYQGTQIAGLATTAPAKRASPDASAEKDDQEAATAAKRQKSAAAGPRIDPITGEEIWGENEPVAPAPKPDAAAAAGAKSKGRPAAATAVGSGGGAAKDDGEGKSGGGAGARNASGTGKGGGKSRKAAAAVGQKNITSFFMKR